MEIKKQCIQWTSTLHLFLTYFDIILYIVVWQLKQFVGLRTHQNLSIWTPIPLSTLFHPYSYCTLPIATSFSFIFTLYPIHPTLGDHAHMMLFTPMIIFVSTPTTCWQLATTSSFLHKMKSDQLFRWFIIEKLWKSTFRIFDSEGTLNQRKVKYHLRSWWNMLMNLEINNCQ